VTFGLHPDADFRAEDVEQAAVRGGTEIRFRMRTPAGTAPVTLAMAGQHNVLNALAAAAAAVAAGASLGAVTGGLGAVRNVPGRLRLVAARQGIRLYDDSYNANPGSVRAAIAFLEGLPGERWLVLGDMAELGPDSPAMHREIGEAARAAGITRLFCAGAQSRVTAEAFGANAEWRESVSDLAALVEARAKKGVTVLVIGSRFLGLERVVQQLAAEGAAVTGH
jgi:UDP-N-acetylmuramoyl-tripeptide--D-alanyl-D-alanine ligase